MRAMDRAYSEEPRPTRFTFTGRADPRGSCGGEQSGPSPGITVNFAKVQLLREKKSVQGRVRAIENRIRHSVRAEEKLWRDLEDVRRQAATVEDGKTRTDEKKLAERTILQARLVALEENKVRVSVQKQVSEEQRVRSASLNADERQRQGQAQRKIAQGMLRRKRAQQEEARWQNEARALEIQQAKLEARTKAHLEKVERLQRMRSSQEAERRAAECELDEAAACIPSLEVEESQCIERLHNSRRIKESVLEGLESSFASQSSLTPRLRSRSVRKEAEEAAAKKAAQEAEASRKAP